MSETEPDAAVAAGLAAWQRGDLDGLERILDPAVTLKAISPGRWDCRNRDQVMELLRARELAREAGAVADVEITALDASTFLVSGLGGPDETATLVTAVAGKIMSMQQVSTASIGSAAPSLPVAVAAVEAVRAGDATALEHILASTAALARGPVPGFAGRTLLHIATDWPGHWPNGPEIVRLLIAHGADPNQRGGDSSNDETPLHWAASSDDADVAAALIDGGADLETPDGSIGTPMDNAIGYACWHVAELLAARGARIEALWHAAALGRLDVLEEQLATEPDSEQISQAFWHACAASQRRTAERLLAAGADLTWTPDYAEGTPLDAANGRSARQDIMINWLKDQGARSADTT